MREVEKNVSYSSFNQMDMTWDEKKTIKGRGLGDLMSGMEEMNRIWEDHVKMCLDTDDDFFDNCL